MTDQTAAPTANITVRVTAMKYRGFYARHEFQAASLDAALAAAKAYNWDNEIFEPTSEWVPVQSLLLETDDEERLVDIEPSGVDAIAVLREFVGDVKLAHGEGDGIDLVRLDWPDLAATYQKAVAVLGGEQVAPAQRNVFVAIYEHSDTDIRLFRTMAQAEAWRTEIASNWWENEFPDAERPADADIAEAYFKRMRHRGEEFFRIEANPVE